MTAQETERLDLPAKAATATRTASTKSSGKAYDRRIRRQEQARGSRLTRTGSPITAALTRVPFVALVLLLLPSGGVVGVLYLNTVSDAAGLRASQSRLAQMDLDSRIEAANKTIAAMKDPAHLAAEAKALGLVPPADAAMIQIGSNGRATVIGTPTPVPSPAPMAQPSTAPSTPAAQATVVVTAAAPVPKVAVPAVTAPVTTPKVATAPKATVPKATAPKAAVPKATPPKATTRRTAAARTTAPATTGVRP